VDLGELGVADSKGMIYDGRDGLNPVKAALARVTNASGFAGAPEAALRDADVFIGLSGATLPEDALARMAPGAIAFLLSNPEPEIHPEVARRHAAVVATGRSDFPNQINNSLAFPGVFRAALDVRATAITENMKLAAADAIAALVGDDAAPEYVIPSQFDERVAPAVAAAVAAQARLDLPVDEIFAGVERLCRHARSDQLRECAGTYPPHAAGASSMTCGR